MLYLGINTCFKLKLKDRGLKDPDLSSGLAYMVNEDSYRAYLDANANVIKLVSLFFLLLPSIADHYDTDQHLWSGP